MNREELITRRLVALILGFLGLVLLLDVLVIATIQPDASLDGFRQGLFVVIGALLIVSGAVSFAWPKRGSVETRDDNDDS